jgi:hypothetical protein
VCENQQLKAQQSRGVTGRVKVPAGLSAELGCKYRFSTVFILVGKVCAYMCAGLKACRLPDVSVVEDLGAALGIQLKHGSAGLANFHFVLQAQTAGGGKQVQSEHATVSAPR